jgi:hypothetical protein
MPRIVCFLLLSALGAAGQTVAERDAIERVITELNRDSGADIFTKDFNQRELAGLLVGSDQVWSEVTRPKLVATSIRLVAPGVALVDGSTRQYGSTILVRSTPVLLIFKKEQDRWRIAALRLLR